jgi:hypothetical protein
MRGVYVLVKTWATDQKDRMRKSDPSFEFIGEVILEINIVYA